MPLQKIAAPILCLWLSSLSGCVAAPAPYEEYSLARAAIRAAQEVDSARFATALYSKAEDAYRNGQKAYKDADFSDAKKYFLQTIQFAERAENATRLKKFQTGDSFP